jgi:hypothetical protein
MVQDAHGVGFSEGHTEARARRECAEDPAESETPGTWGNFMHENRETLSPPASSRTGRKENAMSAKSFMHGGGESYCGIVRNRGKSFEISSGTRRVYTTLAIEFEALGKG